jgi:hypothetical protein
MFCLSARTLKFRGVVVGHVDSTDTRDGFVFTYLAITSSYVSSISAGITARLPPRLFAVPTSEFGYWTAPLVANAVT